MTLFTVQIVYNTTSKARTEFAKPRPGRRKIAQLFLYNMILAITVLAKGKHEQI